MEIANFVLEKNIGYVVNGADIESIRNLVISILENTKEYNTKVENLKKIQHLYSWDEVVIGLNKIFNDSL
jgi:glycosyltransferase involved in cell wall biosynthesis